MMESCFEIMICSFIGVKILLTSGSIITAYDYTSAALNIFFLVILTVFVFFVFAMTIILERKIRSG